MNALTLFDHVFEGRKITTIIYRGRPCWIASEVGRLIGYDHNGRTFTDQITRRWQSEMIHGRDFEILAGTELRDFKAALRLSSVGLESALGSDGDLTRAPSVMLLYESGLHLALVKTNKPRGQHLRRELVDNVLPQIARDGRYSPEREVTPEGQLVDRDVEARRLASEERKLALAEADLEHRRCELRVSMLLRLGSDLTYIGQDIKDMLLVKAAEEAYGRPLTALLPPADESLLSWENASQIGERMGVSSNRVGRVSSLLGLKGADGKGVEGMSRVVTNKAKGHERVVPTYLYSPAAVEKIEQYLRDHGFARRSETGKEDGHE